MTGKCFMSYLTKQQQQLADMLAKRSAELRSTL
jgi:hypothetical protein